MGERSKFAIWAEDIRWMLNARSARAYRRKLLFSQRMKFDQALRPPVQGGVISYPDALSRHHG